ncbi:hypothetical protein ACMV5L_14325 [Serratia plymuthica]|uniref:hypothetical protein n=1 Tax=Serratia plymuthica TaxID=82996 RepID=UPI003DA4D36C
MNNDFDSDFVMQGPLTEVQVTYKLKGKKKKTNCKFWEELISPETIFGLMHCVRGLILMIEYPRVEDELQDHLRAYGITSVKMKVKGETIVYRDNNYYLQYDLKLSDKETQRGYIFSFDNFDLELTGDESVDSPKVIKVLWNALAGCYGVEQGDKEFADLSEAPLSNFWLHTPSCGVYRVESIGDGSLTHSFSKT